MLLFVSSFELGSTSNNKYKRVRTLEEVERTICCVYHMTAAYYNPNDKIDKMRLYIARCGRLEEEQIDKTGLRTFSFSSSISPLHKRGLTVNEGERNRTEQITEIFVLATFFTHYIRGGAEEGRYN